MEASKEVFAMSCHAAFQRVRSSLPPELRHRVRSARELGRNRHSETSGDLFPTPLAPLNRLLDGGLPRGGLVELVGRRSCGAFSTLLSTLSAVTQGGRIAALVDLGDGFSPQSAEAAGIHSERLLWLRPRRLKEALAAAEILISGDFPFVVMDLGPSPGTRGAQGAWLRLARAARKRHATLWVVTPHRVSGNAADAVIEAQPEDHVWGRSRHGVSLLQGIHAELVLRKRAGTAPGRRETLTFHAESPWAATRIPQASLPESVREPTRMATG